MEKRRICFPYFLFLLENTATPKWQSTCLFWRSKCNFSFLAPSLRQQLALDSVFQSSYGNTVLNQSAHVFPSIITQVIMEILALSLAANGVIFCYNHLRQGDYSGRTIFQNGRLVPCLVLSMSRKRKLNLWKKMLFREIPSTSQSSERHSFKIRCENCVKCSKETI